MLFKVEDLLFLCPHEPPPELVSWLLGPDLRFEESASTRRPIHGAGPVSELLVALNTSPTDRLCLRLTGELGDLTGKPLNLGVLQVEANGVKRTPKLIER